MQAFGSQGIFRVGKQLFFLFCQGRLPKNSPQLRASTEFPHKKVQDLQGFTARYNVLFMPYPKTASVALASCRDYEKKCLEERLESLLAATGLAVRPGERILVKPNLVSGKNPLACTEPALAAAVCAYALDHDADVTVADSPAFGSAALVAEKTGLQSALAPLGLRVETLNEPASRELSFSAQIGVSRKALEADRIFNLPRLKAHCQMRLSLAVKNLFGCVTGIRKAIAHSRYGECENRFEAMILDIGDMLPPSINLLDGVTCMHKTGPTDGEALELGFLALSENPVALDTCIAHMLGLEPRDLTLWAEAVERGIPGASLEDLCFPLEQPDAFPCDAFIVPHILKPVSFRPSRLALSALKRLCAHFR